MLEEVKYIRKIHFFHFAHDNKRQGCWRDGTFIAGWCYLGHEPATPLEMLVRIPVHKGWMRVVAVVCACFSSFCNLLGLVRGKVNLIYYIAEMGEETAVD